jgi:hypothetical protein
MKISEIVSENKSTLFEIGYASSINPSSIPNQEFIGNSEIVGSIDNHGVWYWRGRDIYVGNNIYFFVDNDKNPTKILARICLADNELTSILNITKVKGAITALCVFIVNKLGKQIVIPETEPFTLSGINWLCKLIKDGGRGIKITDNYGNYPDHNAIRQEWIQSKYTGNYGSTRLIFDANGVSFNIIDEVKRIDTIYRWLEKPL